MFSEKIHGSSDKQGTGQGKPKRLEERMGSCVYEGFPSKVQKATLASATQGIAASGKRELQRSASFRWDLSQ